MAQLILAARTAREDAQRMRVLSYGLRLSSRDSVRVARERRIAAEEVTEHIRARQAAPLPSPWSELSWSRADQTLQRVLVPVP